MTRLGLAICGAGLGALIAASCAVSGFDLVDASVGGTVATGGGGGGGAGGAGVGACNSASWPAPPSTSDPGNGDVDFTVAIRAIDFGEEQLTAGPTVGYDLDSVCTCFEQAGPSCKAPDYATADHCDGPRGIDNAAAQLFGAASAFDESFSSKVQSDRADQGSWSLLIRIRGYNGQPTDTQVSVALYPSPGLGTDPCLPPGAVPAWTGADAWPIDANAVEGSGGMAGAGGGCGASGPGAPGYDLDQPRYFDDQAYVTGGVVVANLPTVAVVLSGSNSVTDVSLVAGFLTARIEADASVGGWRLRDGLLVGRWKLSDFFATVRTLTSSSEPLCTDHPLYNLLKNAVCSFPDIASKLSGPTTPCDAISFGMGFAAQSAELGFVFVAQDDPIAPCAPGTDPADDSCGN